MATPSQDRRERMSAANRLQKILASLETWQRRFNELDTNANADCAIKELQPLLEKLNPEGE